MNLLELQERHRICAVLINKLEEELYEGAKAHKKIYLKGYYFRNKDAILKSSNEYYYSNKVEIAERMRLYYLKNKKPPKRPKKKLLKKVDFL